MSILSHTDGADSGHSCLVLDHYDWSRILWQNLHFFKLEISDQIHAILQNHPIGKFTFRKRTGERKTFCLYFDVSNTVESENGFLVSVSRS